MKTKILIVEDEPNLLEMYALRLQQDGYEAIKAANGEEGYSLAKLEKPDLILLDIMMPKVDGYELLAELKKDIKLKKTPVIIFSNLSQKEEVEKGLKLGASDFIVKTSLTPAQLATHVQHFLSGK